MNQNMPRKTFWMRVLPWKRKKYLQAKVDALKAHGIYPKPDHWLFDGIAAAEAEIKKQKHEIHPATRVMLYLKQKVFTAFR